MSWIDELSSELTDRGVPRRERTRIVLEFADHIACEPGGEDRLGDPCELAIGFADELATSRARTSAYQAFSALIIAAVALTGSQILIAHAGGLAGAGFGASPELFVVAVVAMLVGPQVALVAGGLAVVRAVRRRRVPRLPAFEIELIARRSGIALAGGVVTLAGLGGWLADFGSDLPTWYLAAVGGFTAAAAFMLVAALRRASGAARIVSGAPGGPGDVHDDLPFIGGRWWREHPWRLGMTGSLGIAVVTTWLQGNAEHSAAEGLQRGVAEGIVAALGYAVLGRALGIFSDSRGQHATASHGLTTFVSVAFDGVPGSQCVGDSDRADAEAVLRDGFVAGRLDVEELTARLSAVHYAGTIAELRQALNGLAGPS